MMSTQLQNSKDKEKINITEITENLKIDMCKISPINILFHKFYHCLLRELKDDMVHAECCPS